MRIGLVSYRCENRNLSFNMSRIEQAMKRSEGKADLLCFGEAFLQGFDSLSWKYEADQSVALELSSEPVRQLRNWTVRYGVSLITGYIEKDMDRLYSSCVVLSGGKTVHNYRRISKGWKEYSITDGHYCEGTDTGPFKLNGKRISLALCGDLWDFPEKFKTENLLIWPVYVNYTPEEWNSGVLEEYAAQAALAAEDVLMVNPLDNDPVNHGGSFHFHGGQVAAGLPFGKEDILFVDID